MGRIREIVEGVEVVSERAAKENNDDDSSFYTTDEEEEEEFADAESTSGDKTVISSFWRSIVGRLKGARPLTGWWTLGWRCWEMGSSLAWIFTTSMILVGLPLLYAYDRERNAAVIGGGPGADLTEK